MSLLRPGCAPIQRLVRKSTEHQHHRPLPWPSFEQVEHRDDEPGDHQGENHRSEEDSGRYGILRALGAKRYGDQQRQNDQRRTDRMPGLHGDKIAAE